MNLYAQIHVREIVNDSFVNDNGESVSYSQIRFIDEIEKKVGGETVRLQELATIGCDAELAKEIEVGKQYTFVLRASARNQGRFAVVKFKAIALAK